MIDESSTCNLDLVTSMFYSSASPYWEKYQQFKTPLDSVVITDYEVLDVYETYSYNEKKNTTTEKLTIVLLLKEVPNVIPEGHYIKLKLQGCTKDSEGKVVRSASVEYSTFVTLCRYQDKEAFARERVREGQYEGRCVHYTNCTGLCGRIALGTTSEYNGFFSYSSIFYIPSHDPEKPYPLSVFEQVVLNGEYRKNKEAGCECDYMTLNKLLTKRVQDFFNTEQQVEPKVEVPPKQRAAAIPMAELSRIKSSPYAPINVNMEREDDDIPF